MQHNHDEWLHDASGNPYARRPTARQLPTQPSGDNDRHRLLGPGIGHRRTDKFFDGIIVAILFAVGISMTVGLLSMQPKSSGDAPFRSDTGSGQCSK